MFCSTNHAKGRSRLRGVMRLLALTLACSTSPLPMNLLEPSVLQAQDTEELVLQTGETRVFPVTERLRVIVGNPRVLQVEHDARQTELVITALAAGFSNLHVGGQVYAVTVHGATDLHARLRAAQSLLALVPGVSVRTESDRLVLDGMVRLPADLERVKSIATTFGALNLVRLDPDAILEQPLVRLSFKVAEVNRKWARSIGVRWDGGVFSLLLRGAGALNGNVPGLMTSPPLSIEGADPADALAQGLVARGGLGTALDGVISLEEESSHYRVRDTHVITTASGREGQYLAGGSVLIPVSTGIGQVSLQEKDYGVRVKVTPTVLRDRRLQLDLDYEISNLLSSGNGSYSLGKRTQNTTITMRLDEVLVLAAQVDRPEARSSHGLPWLARIPVLGALFGNKALQARENDTVIFVTPTLLGQERTEEQAQIDRVVNAPGQRPLRETERPGGTP